ncbi:hypothetical protein [Nodosilinea sp. P-1105]|uniref:hypothetical protein n=1 Tax=Nodosilinea sp. P-1105 TaxID=2546229 RepID=UPI00146A38D5|nr:hypothetical protein [Nodosilinea sp. P-1105]NMF84412.1 hypothetical protein [Nodosilinea sp. P-1105]
MAKMKESTLSRVSMGCDLDVGTNRLEWGCKADIPGISTEIGIVVDVSENYVEIEAPWIPGTQRHELELTKYCISEGSRETCVELKGRLDKGSCFDGELVVSYKNENVPIFGTVELEESTPRISLGEGC